MKHRSSSSKISLYFCFSIALLTAAEGSSSDDFLEVDNPKNKVTSIAILEMLSAEIKSNIEQISTWNGRYKLKDKIFLEKIPNYELMSNNEGRLDENHKKDPELSTISGRFYRTQNATVVFFIRMNPKATFSAYEEYGPISFLNLDSNKSFEINPPKKSMHYSVLDASGWRSYNPIFNKDIDLRNFPTKGIPIHGKISSIQDAESKFRYSYLVDPSRFFGVDDTPFYESLERKIRYIKEHGKAPLRIERKKAEKNDLYILTSELRKGESSKEKPFLAISTFSSDVGFNAISNVFLSPDGKKLNETKWEYSREDGIFIPSKFNFIKYQEGTNEILIERLFTLTESQINEEISDDTFSWGMLGINEGDRVRDNILNKEYRYVEGKMIPAVEYDSKFPSYETKNNLTKDNTTKSTNLLFLIVFNLIILLIFGIIFFLRKKKT